MPYGKIVREYQNGGNIEKYLTTHHERDQETGLDYRGARYYDSDIGRFFSVDPLAHLREWVSPYNYVQNNPIMRIDPDGRLDDEFNVNSKTGEIKKVSDKGGDKVDYYNMVAETDKGKQVVLGTTQIDRVKGESNINMIRFTQDDNSTTSVYHMPETNQSGFILEPGGPSTAKSNLDKRIPEGKYNLDNHNSTKYPGSFKLYNENVSESRKILIHAGNYGIDTEGCLLPGKTGKTGYVSQSKLARDEIYKYIGDKGVNNVKLNIKTFLTY
jgi:RHS repeat-associated protein